MHLREACGERVPAESCKKLGDTALRSMTRRRSVSGIDGTDITIFVFKTDNDFYSFSFRPDPRLSPMTV